MIHAPFPLFEPFVDRLEITLLTRADNVRNDADTASLLGSDTIASTKQVHGNVIRVVTQGESRMQEADGLVTATRDLWLTTRSADCQSFVIYDPLHQVLAVVHAGWKGLKAGVIGSCMTTLREQYKVDAATCRVGAGPSLCTACAEFSNPAEELSDLPQEFFHGRCADLQGVAVQQLCAAGVHASHIDRHPHCTRCNTQDYWSYRGGDRQAVQDGYTNVLCCRLLGTT